MADEHLAVVRRFFDEVWNRRRADLIDEIIDEESVCYTDEGPMKGPREFRERQYEPFLAAFPDLRVEVESMICQGNEVAVRWVATGTHNGDGLGFRATREPVTFRGLSWICVEGDKLGAGWQSSNIADVVRGLAARSTA